MVVVLSKLEKVEAAKNEKGKAASKRSDEEVLRRIEDLKVLAA